MAETSLTTGDLTTADLDAAIDIWRRSFGRIPEDDAESWRTRIATVIEAGRLVGVRDGNRLVAHATLRPFRQYWGGHALPMAGIAGVAVAPDYRGRAVGTMLMRSVVQKAVELGDVVSALYPATIPIYRKLGWELAGAQYRISVDAAALRRLGPVDVAARRLDADDVDAVLAHVRRHWATSGANGPKDLEADRVHQDLSDPHTFGYRTDDGLLIYTWNDGDLVVRHLSAGSAATARTLWSLVGSGSSIAKTVRAYVDPRDPLPLLLDEGVAAVTQQERWMLRLMDAPAAIAGRGFPPGVELDVSISVADSLAAGCNGAWRLRIKDGSGSLERTADDADSLRLGPNGLAALYAGTPLAALRMAGLAAGGSPDHDGLLDTAFAATPFLLEYF